jgi:hypothetical protein
MIAYVFDAGKDVSMGSLALRGLVVLLRLWRPPVIAANHGTVFLFVTAHVYGFGRLVCTLGRTTVRSRTLSLGCESARQRKHEAEDEQEQFFGHRHSLALWNGRTIWLFHANVQRPLKFG